jgi:hypothetical protein
LRDLAGQVCEDGSSSLPSFGTQCRSASPVPSAGVEIKGTIRGVEEPRIGIELVDRCSMSTISLC